MPSYTSIGTITPVPTLNSRRAEMLQQALNNRYDEFAAAASQTGPRAEELRHHEQVLFDERDALLNPGICLIPQDQLNHILWQLVQLGVLRAAHSNCLEPTIPARKFYNHECIITAEEIEASLKIWDSISAQTRPSSREMRQLWAVLTYGLEHGGCHVIPEIQFTS